LRSKTKDIFVEIKTNWFIVVSVERHQPKPQTKPLKNMSLAYTKQVANSPTKCVSRAKIASDIKNNTPFLGKRTMKRITHYLGGTSERSPFEQFFNRGGRSFFVRYEQRKCNVPKNYTELTIENGQVKSKEKNHFGYFINGDFFDNCDFVLGSCPDYTHDMWLDFCGMPSDELLSKLKAKVLNSSHANKMRFVYVTFYINPRGFPEVQAKLNRYGRKLEDRAKSLAKHIEENVLTDTDFSCEVFDTYLNGPSPMAVIKFTRNPEFMKRKNQTKDTTKNAINFALMRQHFSESEIQSLWGVQPQAIAAYKAWATMRGVTITTDDEHEAENLML
jgi:hypothetical protein